MQLVIILVASQKIKIQEEISVNIVDLKILLPSSASTATLILADVSFNLYFSSHPPTDMRIVKLGSGSIFVN